MEAKGILLNYSLKDKTGAWSQPKSLPNVEMVESLLPDSLITNWSVDSVETQLKSSPRFRKRCWAMLRGYCPFESNIHRVRKRLSDKALRMEIRAWK